MRKRQLLINPLYDHEDLTKHLRLFSQLLSISSKSVNDLFDLHDWERDPHIYQRYIEKNWRVLISNEVGCDFDIVADPFYRIGEELFGVNDVVYFVGAALNKEIVDVETNKTLLVDRPMQLVDFRAKNGNSYDYCAPFDVVSLRDIQNGTIYRVKVEDTDFDLFEVKSGGAYQWNKWYEGMGPCPREPDEERTDYTIDELKQTVLEYSPLKIIKTEWISGYFEIAGNEFSLMTMSPWRLFQNDRQIASSFEASKKLLNSLLLLKYVVGLEFSNEMTPFDPHIFLSDDMRVEFFSCRDFISWIISLPGFPRCLSDRILKHRFGDRSLENPPDGFFSTNVCINQINRKGYNISLEINSVVYVVKNPWRLCGNGCFVDGYFQDISRVELIDFIDCISAYKYHKNDAVSFYSKAGYLLEVVCMKDQEDDTYKLLDLCKSREGL